MTSGETNQQVQEEMAKILRQQLKRQTLLAPMGKKTVNPYETRGESEYSIKSAYSK